MSKGLEHLRHDWSTAYPTREHRIASISSVELRKEMAAHHRAFLAPSPLFPPSFRAKTLCRRPPHCCAPPSTAVPNLLNRISTLAGPERGLFGLSPSSREELSDLISAAEAEYPAPHADLLDGTWRLIYTDVEILGSRRIRLGIRTSTKPGFVELGTMWQVVDSSNKNVKTVVDFEVMGKTGKYTSWATFEEEGGRVMVNVDRDELEPEGVKRVLGGNIQLLREIFGGEGEIFVKVGEGVRVCRGEGVSVFEKVEGVDV